MWSAIGAIGAGLVSGLFGKKAAAQQTAYNRQAAEEDRAFQREVFQNQIQWKAQDAKKAGLHPLAALGGGAYSASSVSTPGVAPDYSGPAAQMAKGIGDAFAAYKTKAQLAEEAARADERAEEQHDANMRESAARTLMYNGQALEATRRAQSYTVPMASGREAIPGQVDANPSPYMESLNKYAWPIYPDGGHGDPVPSSELSEAYENAPGIFAYTPYIDAFYDKWRSILTGEPIDGYYHDWRDNRWRRAKPPRHPFRFWD